MGEDEAFLVANQDLPCTCVILQTHPSPKPLQEDIQEFFPLCFSFFDMRYPTISSSFILSDKSRMR